MNNKTWHKVTVIFGVISCFLGGITLGLGEVAFGVTVMIAGWFITAAACYLKEMSC